MTSVRALAVLLWAGCYAPEPPDGAPCNADKECPDGLGCHLGQCVRGFAPCTPIEGGAGALTVPRLLRPLAVDGDLADWPTCFVAVDTATAGLVRDLGAGGRFPTGMFSVAADATHLYVAARVAIVPPLGDHDIPDNYLNNAISVYFDGDGKISMASYDPNGAQIVVDHANRIQAFHTGSLLDAPNVTSATTVDDTTFTIEMSIEPSTLGVAAFGDPLGFDIGFVGGDGAVMSSELVWFQRCTAPACGCPSGDAAPYCDARELGTVSIR